MRDAPYVPPRHEASDLQHPGEGRLEAAPADHPAVPRGKVGVLLANLGTPDHHSFWPMRRYLKEFLSDRRVVDVNRALWWPLLNGIILTVRPSKSGEAYRSIWNEELNESPLLTITKSQTAKVAEAMRARYGDDVEVDFCMRYGNPSTIEKMREMQEKGCERIVFFPLYPQYAAPTTATANDQAFRALMKLRWQPSIRTVPAYYDHPLYIEALARSLEKRLEEREAEGLGRPDVIVASYHGVPMRYLLSGDPYHCQCRKTSRLLRERMGLPREMLETTFQSLFGREEWLRPYTVDRVAELAEEGKKDLMIFAPGFSSDCVETLEEINEEIHESFEEAGGERFDYVPCLNDSDDHVAMMLDVIEREGAGWLPERREDAAAALPHAEAAE